MQGNRHDGIRRLHMQHGIGGLALVASEAIIPETTKNSSGFGNGGTLDRLDCAEAALQPLIVFQRW